MLFWRAPTKWFWMTIQIGWFSKWYISKWIKGNSFNECKHYWQRFTRNDPKYGCNLEWNYFLLGIWCAMIFTSFASIRFNQMEYRRIKRIATKDWTFENVDSKWLILICLLQSVQHLATSYFAFIFCRRL